MNKKDFATSTVLTAPYPATSGTSLVVQSGHGARFPAAPFYVTIHPPTGLPTLDNAEKLLVTAKTTDTLTITRAQGDTTAKTIEVGWRISNTLFLDDIPDTFDDLTDGTTNKAYTVTEQTKLSGIEAGADVTDTANVTSAGALMDSEVDADIKTLALPANTTISSFGASLVDDSAASDARTTLGLGTIATKNGTGFTNITVASTAPGSPSTGDIWVDSSSSSGAVTTDTNPGTAGGSRNYLSLGVIKLCWGRTNSITNAANSESNKSITFPTGFFSRTPTCTASIDAASGSVSGNYWVGASVSSISAQIYWRNSTSSPGIGGIVSWIAIGV